LTDRLSRDEVGSLVFDAASYLADASLMALLEGWDAVLPEDARVRSALDACDPARQQARVDVQGALLQAVQRVLDSTMTGGSAALWSERLSSDVLLGVSSTNLVWSVDSLLKRGEGDALVAAQLVAFDLA
jgi:hypothetical protein